MSKSTISPADEIWSLIKETQRNLKQFSAEAEKRQVEAEKRQVEAERQRAEEKKQQAEQQAKRQAEEDKRRAEEDKRRAEEDKRRAEEDKRRAEIDWQIKKLSAETRQQIKETNEGLKKAKELFETQWGRLMESLVEGDLIKVLNERGIDVKNTYMNVKREQGEDCYEYDIVAGNGDENVVVEVKTTLRVKHIRHFLESLKKFSHRLSAYKGKIIYGAVAYLRAEEAASKYAERQGLFVIKATGNSAHLINKKNFKPKAFS